jgi:hypothetical protein
MAWEMNLLSAVGGALAAGMMAAFAMRISRQAVVGVLAGLLLALTPTFWQYSNVAERYTLNMAFMIGAVWLAWETGNAAAGKKQNWLVALSALMLGISLTLHPSGALLAPFWLVLILAKLGRKGWHWGLLLWLGLPLVLPQMLFLYVPWRWAFFSSWPLLPGIGRSAAVYKGLVHVWYVPGMHWDMIFAYIGGLKGYATSFLLGGWLRALRDLTPLKPFFQQELSWVVILMAVAGFVQLFRREKLMSLLLLGFGVILTLMVAYIHQGKNDAYLLPVFGVILFFAAFSIMLPKKMLEKARIGRWLQAGQWGIVAAISLTLLVLVYPQRDFSRRMDIRLWWDALLAQPIEEQAGLMGHWSDFTPLWYQQQVHGQRTDLWGLFPPTEEKIIDPWLKQGLPLYQAAPTHGWAPTLPEAYSLVPWGKLVRVLPKGESLSCARELRLRMKDNGPVALGVQALPDTLRPYETSVLTVCWRAREDLPRRTFVGLRLTPEDPALTPVEFHTLLAAQWYPYDSIASDIEGMAAIPLQLPLGAAPGTYRAELILFYITPDDTVHPFPAYETIPLGEVRVDAAQAFRRAYLDRETVPILSPRMGPLALKGWYLSKDPVRPGDPVRLDLVWQVRQPLSTTPDLSVRFWGKADRGLNTPPQPLFGDVTRQQLQPGDVIHTVHALNAPVTDGDRRYLVEIRLTYDGHTAHLPVGTITVTDRPHRWQPPADITPVNATFGNIARLTGFTMSPQHPAPGDSLQVSLSWQAISPDETSYKVFIHLIDENGQIVAQHDGFPASGELPTNIWTPDEYVLDTHAIPLPATLPAGSYTLRVGMYDPASGVRLPVSSDLPVSDNALDLVKLAIGKP